MKTIDIGKAYDKIAERWTSDDFPRTNGIEAHERAISFAGSKGYALDIGCGSNDRFIELLKANGFHVEAIDVSQRMVDLAKLKHPEVVIQYADIRDWSFPRKYDLISAWDSIWHIPLNEQERMLKRILGNLAAKGVFIFTTGGVDEPGEMIDSFMGPEMYYSSLGLQRTLEVISEAGCICRHLEYDQVPESHVYIIAQRS